MTRLRIALVCDWFAPRVGGIESHLVDLAAHLRAAGHEPQIVTATPGPAQLDGVPVHRLPQSRLPGWDVIWEPSTLEHVRRILLGERFDLVHGHSLYSPLAHVGMFAAHQLGIPSVLTSHSLLSPSGVLGFSLWNRLHRWGRWPTLITAVSTLAAAEVRVASGRDRVHVLGNGIVPLPSAAEERRGPRRLTVVSVMRLSRRKQPLDLVRAIPRVDAQLAPEERPDFILVGDGPERDRVERLVHRLGLAQRLQRTGALPRSEVRALLARADVFALPTEKEAFGIAILEARAAGLPIVARQGNGASDLVDHGRQGLLAASTAELADHVARLCRDQTLRVRMSAAARAGLERFSWPVILERHFEIYALARDPSADSPQLEAA
jgi:glycosyltransferase involved in cell wall biosynthesis